MEVLDPLTLTILLPKASSVPSLETEAPKTATNRSNILSQFLAVWDFNGLLTLNVVDVDHEVLVVGVVWAIVLRVWARGNKNRVGSDKQWQRFEVMVLFEVLTFDSLSDFSVQVAVPLTLWHIESNITFSIENWSNQQRFSQHELLVNNTCSLVLRELHEHSPLHRNTGGRGFNGFSINIGHQRDLQVDLGIWRSFESTNVMRPETETTQRQGQAASQSFGHGLECRLTVTTPVYREALASRECLGFGEVVGIEFKVTPLEALHPERVQVEGSQGNFPVFHSAEERTNGFEIVFCGEGSGEPQAKCPWRWQGWLASQRGVSFQDSFGVRAIDDVESCTFTRDGDIDSGGSFGAQLKHDLRRRVYKNTIAPVGEVEGNVLVGPFRRSTTVLIPHLDSLSVLQERTESLAQTIQLLAHRQVQAESHVSRSFVGANIWLLVSVVCDEAKRPETQLGEQLGICANKVDTEVLAGDLGRHVTRSSQDDLIRVGFGDGSLFRSQCVETKTRLFGIGILRIVVVCLQANDALVGVGDTSGNGSNVQRVSSVSESHSGNQIVNRIFLNYGLDRFGSPFD